LSESQPKFSIYSKYEQNISNSHKLHEWVQIYTKNTLVVTNNQQNLFGFNRVFTLLCVKMKVNRICCFTAFAITLISVYLSPANGAVPRPPIYGPRGFGRGLNALGGYSGYGRNVQYVPVP